jgi:putative ABC transport system ATP-binding protein
VGLENELEILHGLDIQIYEGEFVSIVGESGSGKSTLMNIIGALDKATAGDYLLDSIDVNKIKVNELSDIRNQKIGFVFQNFNLVSRSNALKNVELPQLYAGVSKKERRKRSKELLELVNMSDRIYHKPNALSGGEKQRVAIARALSNNPAIILADEPTGSLDSVTSRSVMDILHNLHKNENKTIILITHSKDLAEEAQRVITLKDGKIIGNRKGADFNEYS